MHKKILSALALALGLFCSGNCGAAEETRAELWPGAGVRIYIASPGDDFAMLGRRLGYAGELLAAMNDLSPGYCCQGGERLKLPTDQAVTLASRGGELRAGGSGGQIWRAPLAGVVTSAFASARTSGRHHGLDIAADAGTAIRAAHSGEVLQAGWKNSIYGYSVLLDHGNGWQTFYAHCSRVLVRTGQRVEQGDIIAEVGSTGNSTGPHLHLELSKDGVYIDPASYISGLAV